MEHLHYERNYQKAKTAVDAGNIVDGLGECETLLSDPELPRYYRIKTLILLALANKEWRQKEVLKPGNSFVINWFLMIKC